MKVVMGCLAVGQITGFEGVVTGWSEYLYGCGQWGLTPKAKDGEIKETRWFDEGRIQWVGIGVNPADVKAVVNGPGEPPTIGHGRR